MDHSEDPRNEKGSGSFLALVPVRDSQSLPPAAQMKFQVAHPLRFLMKNYKSINSGQKNRKLITCYLPLWPCVANKQAKWSVSIPNSLAD
jgi:hypothetical protein